MAHVPPKENPPTAQWLWLVSTARVELIHRGTSCDRYVSAFAILLSMHMVLADCDPLGSGMTTTGATPPCAAAKESMWPRIAPPVSQSAGPPGCPATRTSTGSAGRLAAKYAGGR